MMNLQGFLDCFSNAHDGDVHINFISTPLPALRTYIYNLVSKYDIFNCFSSLGCSDIVFPDCDSPTFDRER